MQYPEKITDPTGDIGKLYRILLYRVHLTANRDRTHNFSWDNDRLHYVYVGNLLSYDLCHNRPQLVCL